MAPPTKGEFSTIKQAFTNVLRTSGYAYSSNGSGLLPFPQNGQSPQNKEANFLKLRDVAAYAENTPDAYVEDAIELFEINCKKLSKFIAEDCAGDIETFELRLREKFGEGLILSMRVGGTVPNGEFNIGEVATATRLIDYLAGISAIDLE